MSDPPKKFTFGFAKVVKKSNLVVPPPAQKEKKDNVQFIECMEANSIKLKEGEAEDKAEVPLVIPIIGPRKSSTLSNGRSIAEIAEDFSSIDADTTKVKQEIVDTNLPADSLDALAAKEILREGSDVLKEAPASTLEALPTVDSEEKEKLQKESTLEDYENIPVDQFGLAMLRGMGWKPAEGIGKNKQLVAVTAPQVRPKGMGLGADKMLLAAAASKSTQKKDEEELKMVKGAYVKVLAGMHKNQYAQVEGFSDEPGRVVLKMAIGGHVLSVNEAAVILVSKSDYTKNSKVLNAAKFDEFKKKEDSGSTSVKTRKKSPSYVEKSQSPPSKNFKKNSSHVSPKRERSMSPDAVKRKDRYRSRSKSKSPSRLSKTSKKGKYHSRSRSRSPDKSNRRTNESMKEYRDKSKSPYRSQNRRGSPPGHSDSRTNKSSMSRRRRLSSSPERSKRYHSPDGRRSRSRNRSSSKEKYSQRKKQYSESDSDSQSQRKKKKKKKMKHKERRPSPSDSSSDARSRSRSRSPRVKRKEKKHKRSRSKSPQSRRHR